MKVTKKSRFYQITIRFLICSLVFTSLAPTLSVQAREVQVEALVEQMQAVEGVQELALPIPEEIKQVPEIIKEPIIDDPIVVDPIVEDPTIEAPIEDPMALLTSGDEVPLDMYAGRDNSGLKPKDQTGQYNVDEFTGAFSYGYPIQIPQGRNGLQPSVALQYNHRQTNIGSMLGFGWEVSMPSVSRENRTGVDNMYSQNYFLLNGSRLEPISVDGNGYGTYGKLVENDFSKIEFNSANKWIVTDKMGTVYSYGSSALARQDNPGNTSQVYKWMLEEVRDTNDNYVKYEYYKDSGEIYPKKITYTGYGTTDGIFTVNFEPFAHGTPVENNLLNLSYETGFAVQTKYLVDKIDIKIDGSLFTSYDLDLSLNTNQNKYLLDSIVPKYYEGSNFSVKDQVDFEYSYQPTTYAEGTGYTLPNSYYLGEGLSVTTNKRDMFIDLNSDSFTDYIRINCSNTNLSTDVYLNDGDGGWTSSAAFSESFGSGFTCAGIGIRYSVPVSFAELNGDHLIDMVTDTNIYYNNGSGWDSPIVHTLPVSLFQSAGNSGALMNTVMFQDMNKDGYDDIVYNHHPANHDSEVDVYMRNIITGNWDIGLDYNVSVDMASSDCLKYGGDPFGFSDVNNDGLLDVYYNYYCIYSYEAGGVPIIDEGEAVYLNTGSLLYNSSVFTAPNRPSHYVVNTSSGLNVSYIMDVDGDGIFDVGSFSKDTWNSGTDWNSKGTIYLLDQTIFDTGWISSISYYNNSIPVAIADFNGDQAQDVMHSWGSASDTVYYGEGEKLDILEQVNYQSGAKLRVYYDYSANEKDENGNLLNPELPFNIYTVKEVVVDNGMDEWIGKEYQYSDGKAESYPSDKIKDVFGFAKAQNKTGQAMPDVDMGDGSDGVFISTTSTTWTTNKNFTSMHIQSGHTITVESGVIIKVQGQVTIDGILTAEGKGYSGGGAAGLYGQPGGGPGAGGGGGYVNLERTGGGGGAGHVADGQDGQVSAPYGIGGVTYGNQELDPIFAGSGGGGSGYSLPANGAHGGAGGGIVQIFANSLIVNGEINANGIDGGDGDGNAGHYTGGAGGGSGGSINIRVIETADLGTNLIHAYGGDGGVGSYSNNGGNGADGRISVEADTIVGTTNPSYYSLGEFDYSIKNSVGAEMQKTINEYHIAKDDNLYLHGRLKSNSKYDSGDNLLSKQNNNWLTYNLSGDRKFTYLDENINTQIHLLEEGPLAEYSSDASTIALYHMDGPRDTAEKKDNAQGNAAYDLTEENISAIDVGFNEEVDGSYRSTGGSMRLDTNIGGLGAGAFSIEGWIKNNGAKAIAGRPLGNKDSYDHGFYVEYSNDNSYIVFTSSADKYTWTVISDTGLIKLGQWQHFAFVMDTNNAYIYIDGDLAGQAPVTLTLDPVVNTHLVLACHKESCNDAGLFSMDEFRISNVARSGTSIYNYYHNTQEPYYETSVAKENYYNFINGNLDTEANLGKVVANIDTGQITNILSGDEKDTDYEYAQNTTKHILSAPKTRTISDTVDSKEQDLYYNKQAHGSVDKVNLTKEDYITDGVEIDREFNSYGLVNKEISPEKATTTIAYDSHNLYPATTTNDLNQATYTEYNLFNSQVATTTSPTGAKTVNRFDAFGRTKEVWISDADTPATLVKKQEISYQDSTLPRYVEVKDYFDASNFSTSREYYDGLDRVIQKKANTATTGQYTTVDTLYDSQGRVVHQSLPYITNSISYSSPNLTKPAKTYTYDALDRVLSESTPTGVTSYEYDGFKTTITDANGIQKDLTKDAYGNLVEVKEYNGVSTYTTGYDYTLTNKLEKITDSQGNIRNFHYDVLDNLDWQDMVHKSSVATPEKINYTHDKNGNVLTEASFKGDAISYVYDDLNRVLYEKLSGANQISYTYDQNDDVGQLSFADYGGGNSKAYDYDTLGRLRTATTTIENESFVMKYDYNLGGNLKEITYPNGWVVTYAFNGVGQVDEVLLDKGTGGAILSDSIEYNQNGQMTHYERANGVITDYTYDPLENFRLTDLVSVQSTTTLQDMHYDYDNIGNIMQIVDASDTDLAKTVDYQYDDLNRLGTSTVSYVTHPTDDYTRTYQYDAVGNMTYNSNLGVMDYDNDNPHQLSGYDTRTFMYDDAGNMTRNGGITKFAWDHRSRLKSTYDIATENSTYYKYDHNNQRMLKYTEDYVFIPPDPHEEPIMMRGMAAPMGGGGHWEWRRIKEDKYVDKYFQKDLGDNTKSHVYLGNIKLATLNNNDNPYYLLGDHLGSSSILTDDTGTVAEQIDYYPYGSKAYENIVTNMSNEYDFTGKEVDEETGIQYFVNRYYDNETGHFLSIDPLMVDILDSGEYNKDTGVLLANPQELNSYAYAVNNPVVYVDPTGNASLRAWLLNPLGTATIKSHFVGGVGYYQATGKRASADFLDHSLSLNPSDISVRSNNEHSYIIDEIKASGEYKDKLRNLVSEAESNNKDRIIQYSDKNVNKDERLEFNSGDLKTSIHGTYTNLIRGHKENGEWTFNTYITDKYDFSFDSGYDNLFSDSANNYTALGQNLGVVSNYNIDIQFEHKFNR